MRILVTGGAGFIGSHIADRLLTDGHEVVIFDDLSSKQTHEPKGEARERAQIIIGGLTSLRRQDARLAAAPLDAVVHCAAYADLRHNWDSVEERDRLWRSNVDATRALLEAIPPVPIVFLSTAAVYGSEPRYDDNHGRGPFPNIETDANPETCESPYAASKLAGEAMIAAWAYRHKVPWHALRLVNVVGARYHRGVIADFVRMARAGGIHAADDGRQRKPWVHVGDVVDAVRVCLYGAYRAPVEDCLHNLVTPGVYNVTSRTLVSWHDVIDAMGLVRVMPDGSRSRTLTRVDDLGVTQHFVTWEDRDRGAIGDPHELRVSGEKLSPYYVPSRSVSDGIREALVSLGWEGKP